MFAHEYDQALIPTGMVDNAKAFGWKCDECTKVHVAIYFRMSPTPAILEHVPDAQPIVMDMALTEEAARKLLSDLTFELDNPAHGVDGGFQVPEFEF